MQKEIQICKIEVRSLSLALVKTVYEHTRHFPANDELFLAPTLRKTVMNMSTNLTKGTTMNDLEEEHEYYMIVMGQLREILKQITVAAHLKFLTVAEKAFIRKSISDLIAKLDRIVILQNGGT